MEVWTYGRRDVWTYGRMDVWTYGRMDVWTYGRMDVWTYGSSSTPPHLHTSTPPHLRVYPRNAFAKALSIRPTLAIRRRVSINDVDGTKPSRSASSISVSSSEREPRAIEANRRNSPAPSRACPSAMFVGIDTAARRS